MVFLCWSFSLPFFFLPPRVSSLATWWLWHNYAQSGLSWACVCNSLRILGSGASSLSGLESKGLGAEVHRVLSSIACKLVIRLSLSSIYSYAHSTDTRTCAHAHRGIIIYINHMTITCTQVTWWSHATNLCQLLLACQWILKKVFAYWMLTFYNSTKTNHEFKTNIKYLQNKNLFSFQPERKMFG